MSSRLRGAVAGVVASVLCAACQDEVALPTPPLQQETETMAASYDAPTGTVPIEQLRQLRMEIEVRVAELELDWLPERIADALVRLRQRFDDNAFPSDPAAAEDEDRARIRAALRFNRICEGWGGSSAPPDPTANGEIELVAVVEEGRLRPQLWGTASACRTRVAPGNSAAPPGLALDAFIDGTLIVFLYGPLPRTIADAKFLLRFDGEIGRAGQVRALSFDFRIVGPSVEFRYPVADGDIVVAVGIGTFTLRGGNGTFTCDLAAPPCG